MAFNRMTVDGYIATNLESWSCSFAFATTTGLAVDDSATLSAWCDAVMTLFQGATGWAQVVKATIGSDSGIRRVRCYHYDSPGGAATAGGQSTANTIAGSGGVTQPPQIALVASLLTDIPGRRYRGRFYWPAGTGGVSSNRKASGSCAPATVAPAFASMLRSIADAVAGIDLNPVVVSAAGGGSVTPVTRVSVGDVYDTQRRRRDAIVESRTAAVVPA